MVRRILIGLVAALCVASSASAEHVYSVTRWALERQAIKFACVAVDPPGVDCRTAPMPEILYVPMRGGLWGWYRPGTETIQINVTAMNDPFSYLIIVHEAAHYYQWMAERPWGKCAIEKEAFDIDNLYATVLGMDKDPRVDSWDEVKSAYGCDKEPKRGRSTK